MSDQEIIKRAKKDSRLFREYFYDFSLNPDLHEAVMDEIGIPENIRWCIIRIASGENIELSNGRFLFEPYDQSWAKCKKCTEQAYERYKKDPKGCESYWGCD